MPLYTIKKTSVKGQVLFESTDMRGPSAIVSLQMPERRAQQIIDALQIVENLSSVSDACIETVAATNIVETMKELRRNCLKIVKAPIELS